MVPVFGSVPGMSGCSWYLGSTRLSRSVSQTGQHRSNSMFGSGLVRGSHRNFVDVIRKHFISFVRIIALVRSLGFPIKEFSNATNMVRSCRGKEKETAPPEDVAVSSKRARRGTGVEIRETAMDDYVQPPRGHGDVPYRPTWRDGPLHK
ncbi:hypothetical protein HanIR_Chr07g0303691 [Helianthus annuus]|nr:hypothetical protein HanIR_Chr07g0303691 [Helianthus annuus]